ncbi:hypothetical protein [Pontibacter ramchanderi]|uniref:DUF4843 domain-containing protein n=1 Tax=Pontibacter ramchanderi TaxID=1179743 RepID=A0A2N3V3M3_9BACT|nr:hypothetical protein [Pontibacter ramchanderi]PKV76218.1 hypothetical protein BD749_1168 [Pontibacter ramchanderi]
MKSIRLVLYLSLFGASLWLASCNNCETSVAQFQNGDSSWTVYNSGDSLEMVDSRTPDTVRVFLNTRVNAEPIPGDGFGPADVCIEQYYTRRVSVMQHNNRRYPALTVVAVRMPDSIRVSLVVADRAELRIPDINTPDHATLAVGGITYRDVYDVTNPESSPTGVSRILFNREFGFLQVAYANGRTLTRYVP